MLSLQQYCLLSRQGLPIIRWSIRALEDCIYLMWGRSYRSSLQGESEMESQHLRPHPGRKDTLLKVSMEKLGLQCLLPPQSEGDSQGMLTKLLGKLAWIPVTCMQNFAGRW